MQFGVIGARSKLTIALGRWLGEEICRVEYANLDFHVVLRVEVYITSRKRHHDIEAHRTTIQSRCRTVAESLDIDSRSDCA